jgi:hypothetical protein
MAYTRQDPEPDDLKMSDPELTKIGMVPNTGQPLLTYDKTLLEKATEIESLAGRDLHSKQKS